MTGTPSSSDGGLRWKQDRCLLFTLEIVIPTVHLQTERRECVSEEKALGDLFTFLETAGDNLILVGEILP